MSNYCTQQYSFNYNLVHRNSNHIKSLKNMIKFEKILQLLNLACVLRIINHELNLYVKIHSPKTLLTPCIMQLGPKLILFFQVTLCHFRLLAHEFGML